MEYVLALAKYRNFTLAARHCYVTQPAFSRHIAMIEKELGFSLFLRSSKSVELTPAGETMVAAFKSMMDTYQRALQTAARQVSEPKDRLFIGFLKELGDHPTITRVMRSMILDHPDTDFQFDSIRSVDIPFALEAGLIDIVITVDLDMRNMTTVSYLDLDSHQVGLFISANHPLAKANQFSIENVRAAHVPVIAAQELSDFENFSSDLCMTFGVTMSELTIVPNIESMLSAVETGLGVTIFSWTARLKANQGLKFLPLDRPPVKVVVTWKTGNTNPLVRVFLDLVRNELK
jgi:DNA-binding transcriptional LysR family regulator